MKITIRKNPDLEAIEQERRERNLARSPSERLEHLFRLQTMARKMNGGKPLKVPEGKGLLLSLKKK